MKKALKLTFKLIFIASLLLTNTCKEELVKVTKLEIGSESNVTESSATVVANFIDLSGNVTAFGFCYATNSKPEVSDGKTTISGAAKIGEYTDNLTALSSSTKYYVRAYAMDDGKAVYSDKEIDFTTHEAKDINITAPITTDNWTKGSTETITWTDNIDENVHIELYKDGTLLEDIIASTESDQTHNWTLRDGLDSGTDYSIKISSVDDTSISAQSEEFEISETPEITITAPINTSNWQMGSTQNITWTDNISEKVNIELFKGSTKVAGYNNKTRNKPDISFNWTSTAKKAQQNGVKLASLEDIATDIPSNGNHHWLLPTDLVPDNDYTIKITSVNDESVTDESAQFTISEAPYISIITPDASTSWQMGTTQNITWMDNIAENVKIELFKGGAYQRDIYASTSSDEIQEWAVPTDLTAGTDYKIRISSSSLMDESEAFEITEIPNITITAPTSGNDWQKESTYDITWDYNIDDNINIELFKEGTKVTTDGDIALNTTSTSPKSWTVPASLTAGTDYKIKITSVDGSVTDESDNFTISDIPAITITAPTSSNHWLCGNTYSITWTDNIDENIKIELCQGGTCENINASTPSNGSFPFTPTGHSYATNYTIKITSINNGNITDESEQFTISEADGSTGTVSDTESNTYFTIKINKQWWMAENLKAEKYINGIDIIGFRSYNDNPSNKEDYGLLYTSSSVGNGSICPSGWHVPTDAEWKELEMYLGMSQSDADASGLRGTYIGSKLAGEPSLWTDGFLQWGTGFNSTGFVALPGGIYRRNGSFLGDPITYSYLLINDGTYFWTSSYYNFGTLFNPNPGYRYRYLIYNNSGVGRGIENVQAYNNPHTTHCSIRCIKD